MKFGRLGADAERSIMDKLRAKAKRRRNELRRKEAAEADKNLAKEFNDYYAERGMRHDFSPKAIRRAYKIVERESTCEAVVANTIITLWVMNKLCGYGSQRLFRLASEITIRIGWVGRDERSIKQLDEELQLDAHLSYMDYWKKPDISKGLSMQEYQRRDAVLKTVPYTLPIHLHAVFYILFSNTISRRSIRMERITKMIIDAVKYAVENGTLDSYRADLERHGFTIDMRGRYGGKGVKEEEYNKYMKRIKPYV